VTTIILAWLGVATFAIWSEAWLSLNRHRFASGGRFAFPAITWQFITHLPLAWLLIGGGGWLALSNYLALGDLPSTSPTILGLSLIGLGLAAVGWGGYQVWQPESANAFRQRLTPSAQWFNLTVEQLVCLGLSLLLTITTGLLTSHDPYHATWPTLATLTWGGAILLGVVGSVKVTTLTQRPSREALGWTLLLTGLGLTTRLLAVGEVPIVLTGDEGSVGLTAITFLQGQADNLFGMAWHSFPALYFFIHAVPIAWLGPTALALRLPAALAGAGTVGAAYLLGRSLFNHRVGLLAALFLSALHFHLHFSRLALNNVWDGLNYVIVLGALWQAWRTGQRSAFVVAGLSLGLSQYFYPSARMLVVLVGVWLGVTGLFNFPRFKRYLPDLVLMALLSGVVVLPLLWFYALRPDEFFGPMRAQSILGTWLTNEIELTGQSATQILAHQLWLGFTAFTTTPLQFWYKPGVPILRSLPSLFFFLSLGVMLFRWRDPRSHLLALWLAALGLIGALSESTPAAQRYVAAAPVCALAFAYGLEMLIHWGRSWWPRGALALNTLALILTFGLALDDLQFYLYDYTPESHYGGGHDFEGLGGAVAMRLAHYFGQQQGAWQLAFFGRPVMGYDSIPSLQYLTPYLNGVNLNEAWGSPQNPPLTSQRLIFVFLPGHETDLTAVQAAYPGGFSWREVGLYANPIYDLYQVPPPVNATTLLPYPRQIELPPLWLWWGGVAPLFIVAWWLFEGSWRSTTFVHVGAGLAPPDLHEAVVRKPKAERRVADIAPPVSNSPPPSLSATSNVTPPQPAPSVLTAETPSPSASASASPARVRVSLIVPSGTTVNVQVHHPPKHD